MPHALLAQIPEDLVPGRRVGRHIEHDMRSVEYSFDTSKIASVVSVLHERQIPILDQGDKGSCTGNSELGALGSAPIFATLPTTMEWDEQEALALYSLATQLDGFAGTYPPDDTGSSGLAVCKAAVKSKFALGYQHTFDLTSALKALQVTPFIAGINWYDSFDQPDANGLVKISPNAQVRGGHEIVFRELTTDNRLGFDNSWGLNWGLQGRAYLPVADFERLLSEKGDVTITVPLPSTPAPVPTPVPPTPDPTPTPTPTPDAVDRQMWNQMQAWAKARGLV